MIFTSVVFADTNRAPADIEKLFDLYTREQIEKNPGFAVSLGLSDALGY